MNELQILAREAKIGIGIERAAARLEELTSLAAQNKDSLLVLNTRFSCVLSRVSGLRPENREIEKVPGSVIDGELDSIHNEPDKTTAALNELQPLIEQLETQV